MSRNIRGRAIEPTQRTILDGQGRKATPAGSITGFGGSLGLPLGPLRRPGLGGAQELVELLRGLALEAGQHVGVGVERDADLRVPTSLLDHLGMHAERQQDRGRGVTQVVEADVGEAAGRNSGLNSYA